MVLNNKLSDKINFNKFQVNEIKELVNDYINDNKLDSVKAPPLIRRNLMITIAKALKFNSIFEEASYAKNVSLVKSPEEILEAMKIRSSGFEQAKNNKGFPDLIPGLNWDEFDQGLAAILVYKDKQKVIGTSRIIVDSELQGLLSEGVYDIEFGYDVYRNNNQKRNTIIAELSRTAIAREYQKNIVIFPRLMASVYNISKPENLNIGTLVTAVRSADASMYERMGMKVIKNIENYAEGISNANILAWELFNDNGISQKFQKIFLNKKHLLEKE